MEITVTSDDSHNHTHTPNCPKCWDLGDLFRLTAEREKRERESERVEPPFITLLVFPFLNFSLSFSIRLFFILCLLSCIWFFSFWLSVFISAVWAYYGESSASEFWVALSSLYFLVINEFSVVSECSVMWVFVIC